MTVRSGGHAAVGVSVATLWSSPDAVRPLDAPALAPSPDLPRWVRGMTDDERVGDPVLSQLTLGEPVLVEEVRDDGWARVVSLDQPAKLDPRGYPGWLPAAHLAGPAAADGCPLVVDAPDTDLHATPGGPVALPGVVLGTRLTAATMTTATTATTAGRAGPAGQDGWRAVCVPGRPEPLWARAAHLAERYAGPPVPAGHALAVARRLLGAPYVWGGATPYGIDCSGLVRLAWRRWDVPLPRDADDQAAATEPVRLGEERVGDLYFFARPGRHIHHVGIVTGPRRMLHACYTERVVVEEDLPADRAATLVAAHRVDPSARHGVG